MAGAVSPHFARLGGYFLPRTQTSPLPACPTLLANPDIASQRHDLCKAASAVLARRSARVLTGSGLGWHNGLEADNDTK